MHHRVFVVEDHPVMLETLVQFLELHCGVEVCGTAGDVASALAALPASGATLLIADVSLPDGNGFELVEEVRRRWPHLRCIVLTGHHEPFYRQRAMAAGAEGFAVKGDPSSLLTALRRVDESTATTV